jgi:hypothetical protein
MNKNILYAIGFLSISVIGNAQSFDWVASSGAIGWDKAYSITTDADGNTYTTGHFQGTVDFDPGSGEYDLASAGENDVFVQKLDADGNFVWALSFGGLFADRGRSIATDASGNVYLTGFFDGTVDFDPGSGDFDLTSEGDEDVFVQKLDTDGNFEWAISYGDTYMDIGASITTDASGNVYVTGNFDGTVDFDPGSGVTNLTSVGLDDVFIQKLDTDGNLEWAVSFGGDLYDRGTSVSTDASGNVFTTGIFRNAVDFDPGSGVNNLTSAGGYDVFVHKLDTDGNFVWARSFGGGSWDDAGLAVTADASGNVYTTGFFYETVDFDPGSGVSDLTSEGDRDVFLQKLDASGNFEWAVAYGSSIRDEGTSITTDASGNIYLTGIFQETVDFDPGSGVTNLTSAGNWDVFLQKLDADGNSIWAGSFGGEGMDDVGCIALDASGDVYTTGSFRNTVDFDPGSGVTDVVSTGDADVYVHKMHFPTIGIEEESTSRILLYPNPAYSKVQIEGVSKIISIEVLNLTGQSILTSNESIIDVSSLPKGTYLITVTTDDGKIIKRFIKE